MDISLTFLGTSNAVPTAKRNHPAILVSCDNENILIDCGEGTQRQFKKAGLNMCKITRIFLTHLHGDHVFGLPGIIKTLEMSEYSKTLQIYGPTGTKNHIRQLENLYGHFGISHEVHDISGSLDLGEYLVSAKSMDHGIPTNAYSFEIKEKLRINKSKLAKLKLPNSPLIGQLAQGKDVVINNKKIKYKDVTYMQDGKKIAFILDTRMNANAIQIAKSADLVVCEATYSASEEDYASEHKHLTAAQAATIAKKAGAKKLALTHISQRYEHNLNQIESEARKVFKNTIIPSDLDTLTV